MNDNDGSKCQNAPGRPPPTPTVCRAWIERLTHELELGSLAAHNVHVIHERREVLGGDAVLHVVAAEERDALGVVAEAGLAEAVVRLDSRSGYEIEMAPGVRRSNFPYRSKKKTAAKGRYAAELFSSILPAAKAT